VTDPSFIGQILACPKCESMVLVEPPPAGAAETPQAGKPAAVSGSSSVVLRAPIVAPPPLPPVAAPPVAAATVAPVRPVSPVANATAPALPAKAPQNWRLFAGGIAVGVIIGAAIWMLVAMRDTGGEPVAISTAQAATIDVTPEPPPAPEKIAAQEVVETPASPVAPQPQPVEALKPVVEPTVVEPEAPPETAKPEVVRPEVPAVVEPTKDETPIQPAIEPVEATKPVEEAEPAPEPSAAKSITTDPQLAQLNVRLPKVAFTKVPLRQFVTFAAEASGSNIVIDYRSLRAAGFKSPTVTARASDCTLSELLHESLDKIGLSFEPREGSIVIFAP